MKKLLASAVFAFALVSAANAETVAVVNGQEISRAELEGSLADMAGLINKGKPKLEDLPIDVRKTFIDKYIERKLLLDDARAKGVNKDPEIVSKIKEAEDYLIQQKYITDMVLKQKSDAKLKQIFKDKYASKGTGDEVKASHILVKTEAEAKAIKEQLNKGENFEKLAKEKSIDPGSKITGGDLGYFTAEQMVPEFSKVAFTQKDGQISDPVQSQFGWHIIKTFDKRKRKPVVYKDVQQAVEQDFATSVIEDKVAELKKTAKVEYKIKLDAPAAKPAAAAPAVQPKKIVVNSNINKTPEPTKPEAKEDGKK